jgi:branched-chain amino acid transport system ATP-binding protein
VLSIESLTVKYGSVQAVKGIGFEVADGEVVTIVGPNGAGKSSTLMAIAGGLEGASVGGVMTFDGRSLRGTSPEAIVRNGIALVPERRRIFADLTVGENLVVAITSRRDKREARADIGAMLERFPALGESRARKAGLLSGGQQQQLAIARALLTKPKLLMLDEPSLGLAPLVIEEIFRIIAELRQQGISILLLEQNALMAVEAADRALLLRNGLLEEFGGVHDAERVIARYFGIDPDKVAPET